MFCTSMATGIPDYLDRDDNDAAPDKQAHDGDGDGFPDHVEFGKDCPSINVASKYNESNGSYNWGAMLPIQSLKVSQCLA